MHHPFIHYARYSLGLTVKVLLAVVLSLLALELLLTVFNDLVFRNSFYMYDADLGFKVRPYVQWGRYQTNKFGFNDQDYPLEKAPDTYRILILSDSFNWAGGPTGNYTTILERKLKARFGDRQVEVITAGYPQTHTGEQLEILKKFGLQYEPDLVVLGFFVGNDFIDAQPWRRRVVVGGTTVDINPAEDLELTFLGQPIIFRQPFALQSRLLLFLKEQWLTRRYVQTQNQPNLNEQPADPEPAQQQAAEVSDFAQGVSLPSDQYLAMEYFRMQVSNWQQDSALRPSEDYVFDRLLAMQALLAEQNIDFMVVSYPDEFQVDEALRQAVIDRYSLDPTTYQWDKPQGRLWQFGTEHQIEFYDMLPVFQAAYQQGDRLYLPNDSHWNQAGNELAANFLFDILVWKIEQP